MFRFLIVEDDDFTRIQMGKIFCETFVDSRVDTADSVAAAQVCLEQAMSEGWVFDAVVLDFKLPTVRGDNPEVDISLCAAIRDTMPDALVAHLTAYQHDTQIQEHLNRIHLRNLQPRAFTLSKDISYPIELLKKFKEHLYGVRIEEMLAAVLSRRGLTSHRHHTDRQSLTMLLSLLFREIATHWDDLDVALKQRIRSQFDVEDGQRPVRISLFSWDAK